MAGTPVTVMTPNLLGAGTYFTQPLPITVPANGIAFVGLLSDADASDPTKKLKWAFEYSFDGITFDGSRTANDWEGGQSRATPPAAPWILPSGSDSWSSSQVPPVSVRVRLEIPAPLSVGGQLTN